MDEEPISQLEEGLPHKEWNDVLDRYLIENIIDGNLYLQLNDAQRYVIQELKKSFKRIKSKQNEI